MKNKSLRFIMFGFLVMIVMGIGIVAGFVIYMSQRSNESVNEISMIYMGGMNNEIARHFETNINLRLSQMGTIIDNYPPQTAKYGDEMFEKLETIGQSCNFVSLSLFRADGESEVIYGDDMTLVGEESSFLESLNGDEKRIALARNALGEYYALLGVPTAYPMRDGKYCTALVAGFPIGYFNSVLALEQSDSTIVFSNVLTKDGDYIIKNDGAKESNYFERIRKLFRDLEGRDGEDYIRELKEAMENKEDYATVFLLGEERRHLYCSVLPNSDWYLLTVLPYGSIEGVVGKLSEQRMEMLVLSILALIVMFMIMFIMYYRRTHIRIAELDYAREEAIRANRAKSEFLSNMSHDIRTPMNAIVGMTSIAISDIDNKEHVRHCLKRISQSNKQLLGLINDILDMSKIEHGQLSLTIKLVSLRQTMDDIVSIIQPQIKAKNQKFEIRLRDVQVENIYTDNIRLNQIALNLLSNAVKFTPEGGSVLVSLYQEDSPRGDEHVRTHILVKDNGIGMSEEFKKNLFESFAREDRKRVQKTAGIGLGMAITKYIVDAMDGTIEVKSEKGKGTEFHVIIDFERAFVSEENMMLPGSKMLVVDDDEELCKNTADCLGEIGVRAEWATDGESAIRMIEEQYKKGTSYEIILLDWCMPQMDGIQTARQIHQKVAESIPIILISAYDWSEIEEEAKEVGVIGFISKPLFKSTLYHTLKHFVGGIPNSNLISAHAAGDFSGVRVLLAEDNELNWEIAKGLLSPEGFELVHAENGKECVELFEQSPEGYYSVILMDVRMPLMTGYQATESIRSLERPDSDIPIIAMTADAFSEDIQKCLEVGMNAHVAKPINLKEITGLIESYL